MAIVKFRTWRHALSQSLPTMCYSRPNGECKAAVVDDTVAQYSVIL